MPGQVTFALWAGVAGALLLPAPAAETGPVTEWLRVREIDDHEGRRLVRIVRRGSGSVRPDPRRHTHRVFYIKL